MPNEDIIRAWKDENYFHELSKEARANIPKNPAGELQISRRKTYQQGF
jgi:mersacidin/lichenicidin family type 2 lantibiotic